MENNLLPILVGDGLTKAQIKALAAQAVDQAHEGHLSPLRVAEGISALEEFLKELKKDERLVELVREELGLYEGNAFHSASGAKLEQCEAGVSYDYSQDSTWNELKAEADRHTKALKAYEDKLKKIPAGKLLVDEETGESLVGPVKTSKSTYKVTLAKS